MTVQVRSCHGVLLYQEHVEIEERESGREEGRKKEKEKEKGGLEVGYQNEVHVEDESCL